MNKYIKKPIEVEAEQFINDPESLKKLNKLVDNQELEISIDQFDKPYIMLKTANPNFQIVREGDYIVKQNNEFYVCPCTIFSQIYEKL